MKQLHHPEPEGRPAIHGFGMWRRRTWAVTCAEDSTQRWGSNELGSPAEAGAKSQEGSGDKEVSCPLNSLRHLEGLGLSQHVGQKI